MATDRCVGALPDATRRALAEGELEILGRIMPASNHTYLVAVGTGGASGVQEGLRAVYKPTAGERPLWDFPDGTLARRERAAYLVSELLGWHLVPPTLLREGPAGPGMVQLWCEVEQAQDGLGPVDLVPAGAVPDGYRAVLDAEDETGRPVTLIHEDSAALRLMALFDVVVNNTDRKGGHVLALPGDRRAGVDHGVCFHTDDKLRTVLWGWAGEPITTDERAALSRLAAGLDGGRPSTEAGELATLLDPEECAALTARTARLIAEGRFPRPHGGWPPIPWPPF